LESQFLKDKIIGIYENHPEVIMVAAAGTSVFDVTFPGTMTREVVTATIVDYKPHPPFQYVLRGIEYFPDEVAYGPAVDVAAVHGPSDIPTTGDAAHPVTTIGGSSCSTALIAGIIAIAWSRLPHLSRDQLLERLWESAHSNQIANVGDVHDSRTSTVGYGVPDAYLTAGGARQLWIDRPLWQSQLAYTLTAHIDGDPTLYGVAWDNGTRAWTTSGTTDGVSAQSRSVRVTNLHDGHLRNASITVPASAGLTLRISDVVAEGLGDDAVLDWTTSKPATANVDYGLHGAYTAHAKTAPGQRTAHNLVLRGLKHKATYAFQITCLASDGSKGTFQGSFYNPDSAM
jgi:hypothetical protein